MRAVAMAWMLGAARLLDSSADGLREPERRERAEWAEDDDAILDTSVGRKYCEQREVG